MGETNLTFKLIKEMSLKHDVLVKKCVLSITLTVKQSHMSRDGLVTGLQSNYSMKQVQTKIELSIQEISFEHRRVEKADWDEEGRN